ncbi:MAG: aldo/keto reductase [SAR202 cluster bacterium]|nr:aldo/keto reductase [SAR202 cluster bacterium]
MEKRVLGKTGLEVSLLGIGLFEIGLLDRRDGVRQVTGLLNAALDMGINFLDTGECYYSSEDLIGKAVSGRRREFVLATKFGHAVESVDSPEWSKVTLAASLDRSLRRLQTDHVDIIQLHSCTKDILEAGEVIEALFRAREAGKARYIGYSGDNDAALWAARSGAFDTLQTSFNLVDQLARKELLGIAEANHLGIIIKRPIGNTVWGAAARPGLSRGNYYERAVAMSALGPLPDAPEDAVEMALGFIFSHPQVDTAIVGTTSLKHLKANVETIEKRLPISPSTVAELRRRFDILGKDWPQQK